MKWKRRLMERTMKCHVVKRTSKVNSYFNLNENQQFDSLNSRLVWRRGDVFLHVDAIAYKQIHVQQTNSHTFASVWCPWQCVLCVASIVTIFQRATDRVSFAHARTHTDAVIRFLVTNHLFPLTRSYATLIQWRCTLWVCDVSKRMNTTCLLLCRY